MSQLLVVEDEPEARQVLETALTGAGLSVQMLSDGTRAVELYRRERPDLVICDVKLPGLDGLSVLEALKGMDPWTTVILLTAYGTVEIAVRAMRLGAYEFLEKPVTVIQIQQVVQRALDYRHHLHELTLLQGRPGKASDIPSRLTELEELRTGFLELMIQELRDPSRLLSEELTLALRGFYGPWSAKQRDFLNRCSRVQAQLSRLLTGGLALYLNHEQRLCPKEVDLISLYRPLLEQAEGLCQAKGVCLTTAWPTSSLTGLTDADKALQIARELLDNAVRLTPSGGRVEFRLSARGPEGFQLQVEDTGPGIPAELRPWLFTTFQAPSRGRLNPWKKRCLGLALVQHDVDLMQGTVSLEDRPGGGSCFRVFLPWLTPTAPVA